MMSSWTSVSASAVPRRSRRVVASWRTRADQRILVSGTETGAHGLQRAIESGGSSRLNVMGPN